MPIITRRGAPSLRTKHCITVFSKKNGVNISTTHRYSVVMASTSPLAPRAAERRSGAAARAKNGSENKAASQRACVKAFSSCRSA